MGTDFAQRNYTHKVVEYFNNPDYVPTCSAEPSLGLDNFQEDFKCPLTVGPMDPGDVKERL